MTPWQVDLLNVISESATEEEVFSAALTLSKSLGFDFCAYGIRHPTPFSNPKFSLQNNYPTAWMERYQEAGYLLVDPSVQHGRITESPLVWSDRLFEKTPSLWKEAQDFGLRYGWAQSCLNANSVGGMLTVSRSNSALTQHELAELEPKLKWLVSATHLSLSKILITRLNTGQFSKLTPRELEVLKWTADGKSAVEIGEILAISKHSVDFHIKNAVRKLQTSNKTAAVVRAATLGLLN